MKLSIIIVSFNTKTLLEKCLYSIFRNYSYQLNNRIYEVIVVDNNSTDGSISMLEHFMPRIKLLINNDNQGFSKANNQGVKLARGEYVLFLNPDTTMNHDTLLVMLDFMDSHPHVGISTCKVKLPNGKLDDACNRGFPTPWRALTHFLGLGTLLPQSFLFNGYHLGYRDMDKSHEIDACAGAFLLIRRKIGEAIKWFDEDYFWYGEDLDICYRVKKQGFQIMYIPNVQITHLKGAASGIKSHSQHLSVIDEQTKKRIIKARFEVMRIFYKKHYRSLYPRWLTNLVFLGISIKQMLTELSL